MTRLTRLPLLIATLVLVSSAASAQVFQVPPYVSSSGASCAGLVVAQTYGSATTVPILTVDAHGCLSEITTASIFSRGTITTNSPFAFAQTLNNAGEIFRGLTLDITETAASGSSQAIRVRRGTQDLLTLGRAGNLYAFAGVATDGILSTSNDLAVTGGSSHIYFSTTSAAGYSFGQWLNIRALAAGQAILRNGTSTNDNQVGFNYHAKPTISNAFGTGDVIAGVNSAGSVTVGASPDNSGTLTFSSAWQQTPYCIVVNATAGRVPSIAVTTTTLVIADTFTEGDVLTWLCIGAKG